jgi:plastocyanin
VRKALGVVVVLAAAGLFLVACGSDDDEAAKPAAFELVQTGGADPTLNGPGAIEAGAVAVSFKNTGQQPADLQLVSIDGDHSVDEVLGVVGNSEPVPIPDWLTAQGGLGTVAPGQTSTATMVLDKGKYYAVGMVETEDDSDGPPPAVLTLDITGDGGGSLPKADGTITAKEYTFTSKGLKAGTHTVKFENTGQQLHHLIAGPIADGKTIDDVKAYFGSDAPPVGPPPVDFENSVGTAVIDKGKALVTTFDLKAGKYAFVCFLNDRDGGEVHASKGMVVEVDIPA